MTIKPLGTDVGLECTHSKLEVSDVIVWMADNVKGEAVIVSDGERIYSPDIYCSACYQCIKNMKIKWRKESDK